MLTRLPYLGDKFDKYVSENFKLTQDSQLIDKHNRCQPVASCKKERSYVLYLLQEISL